MNNFLTIIGAAVFGLAVLLVIAILLGFPIMWLWNWLIPVIFGLPKIKLLQAIGLNILSGLLIRPTIHKK